jgi:hypothetical protein
MARKRSVQLIGSSVNTSLSRKSSVQSPVPRDALGTVNQVMDEHKLREETLSHHKLQEAGHSWQFIRLDGMNVQTTSQGQ